VYGTPFHRPPPELAEAYDDTPLAEFLAHEARYGCGNYLLVAGDGDCLDVVTAPAYCGGYVCETGDAVTVASTLHDAVSDVPLADLSLDERFVRHYLSHADEPLYSRLPLSGPFREVTRLPPGSHLRVEDGGVVTLRHYLSMARDRPASFGEAIEEAAATLRGRSVGVMYSGGVDSTALCCALDAHLPRGAFELTTVDIGPNMNSVERARTAAEGLGMDLRVVDHERPVHDDELLSYVESQMARDFVNPLEPEFAYAALDHDYDVVVGGETTDVLLTGDMHRPQTTQLQHLRATPDFGSFLQTTVRNAQFTDRYRRSAALRRLYTTVVPHLLDREVAVDPSELGYLAGLLSTVHPNFVVPDQTADVATELDAFGRYAGELGSRRAADTLQFVYEVHNTLKRASTFPKGTAQITLVPPWGPFSSYAHGRSRPLREAVATKREVYEYVRSKVGRSYFDFAFTDPDALASMAEREVAFKSSMRSRLLERNRHVFEGESALLPLVSDPALRDRIREAYAAVASHVGSTTSFRNLQRAGQLLNLETVIAPLQ